MKKNNLLSIIKKYKMHSFYSQLVLMIVTLTTFLSIICVIILCYLRNNMIEQEQKIQEITLSSTIEHFDEILSNAHQSIYTIGSNYVMTDLYDYQRNIESYAENKNIEDLISKLYLVYHSTETINNIFIFHIKNEFIVDQNGITDKSVYFKNKFGENAEFWEELAIKQHKFTLQISQDRKSLYILNSIYYKSKPIATVFIDCSISYLQEQENFHQFTKNRIICLTDIENNIIGYLSEKQDDELVYEAISNGNVNGYLMLKAVSSAGEINFITLTPLHIVTEKSTILFAISLSLFVITTFLGIFISLCIANRICQPLYHAMELIETAGTRNDFNEFAIIEHNVSTILKHNQAMTVAISRSIPIVLETIFRRLIMEVGSAKDFEEILDLLSIEIRDGYYMSAVIYTHNKNEDMQKYISNLFEENVVSLFQRHKNEYVLILFLQTEKSREIILEQCEKLLKCTNAIIALGKMYDNLYSIENSYNDALRVLDNRNANISETEVFDAYCDYEYISYVLPDNLENILYNYILSGNCSLVIEFINQSLQKNLEIGISFKEYLQLIHVYESYLMRMYENMDSVAQAKIQLTLYNGTNFSMQSAEKRIKVMLENYLQVTEFYHANMQDKILLQILKYIDCNMSKDIGLDDIAAELNLTSNYLTKYFKNKTGMNFKTFLTTKRMEKAKELLTETNMLIKDISEKCGYNSSKQFIVNFTKMTGISPTEYRKHYKP